MNTIIDQIEKEVNKLKFIEFRPQDIRRELRDICKRVIESNGYATRISERVVNIISNGEVVVSILLVTSARKESILLFEELRECETVVICVCRSDRKAKKEEEIEFRKSRFIIKNRLDYESNGKEWFKNELEINCVDTGEVVKGYDNYLKSEHWNNINSNKTGKCSECGKEKKFTVYHHNNYKNLGNESAKDLVEVCDRCNKKIHMKMRKQ
ncbi:MAG: hypothetical protein ACRCX8_01460 [Sarcina sp.]